MAAVIPPCPASLKQIAHYLKAAQEHDSRDVVVSYWCRLYSLQVGLKISTQQPEETKLLIAVMDWLERTKKDQIDNDAITNEVAAQAHLENYALKLFMFADKQDRESNFGKNVVKAFYTAGLLYDVMQTFGELTDESTQNRKYAKWKAAYIHNCLKNGETPLPGPMANEGEDNENEDEDNAGAAGGSADQSPSIEQPPPSTSSASSLPPPDIQEILENPDKLPSPPVDEEKPGGFEPFVPPPAAEQFYIPPQGEITLSPDIVAKAHKYCRYAGSALTFDDIKTAIENLQNALKLLTTGHE